MVAAVAVGDIAIGGRADPRLVQRLSSDPGAVIICQVGFEGQKLADFHVAGALARIKLPVALSMHPAAVYVSTPIVS